MNYIELINFFWRKHEEHLFGPTEIALYFHLLDISNKCNWTNPFKRRNTKICSDLNISKPTLDRSRNKLSQAGLIRFISVGKGDPNIKYILLDGTEKEQEKLKNITSDVTTSVTSPVTSNVQHNINLKQKPKTKEFIQSSLERKTDFEVDNLEKLKPFEKLEKEKGSAEKEKDIVPTPEHADAYFQRHYTSLYELVRKDNQLAATPELRFQLLERFWAENVDQYEVKMPLWGDIIKHFRNWVPQYTLVKQSRQTNQISKNNGSKFNKAQGSAGREPSKGGYGKL